jgi:uncharacterized protein YjbI with pentapeptide repeats
MANPEHLAKLKEGVEAWNQWTFEHPLRVDLSGADLSEARLDDGYLCYANLRGTMLGGAKLNHAKLLGADLRGAILSDAELFEADLKMTDLRKATLYRADPSQADLKDARLSDADLNQADLTGANLNKADLRQANLDRAILVGTNFEEATLTGCNVYGIAAWDLRLRGTRQSNLIISKTGEHSIQVDNLEVAQFIYLLLNNERIRHVIDTITSKVVLILGRFTPERKAVLDAIRDELRKRDYLPILFDFEKPDSKDLTGTVTTLANMARFIIADLTDPSSVPHELAMVVPGTVVPVQTILLKGQREYAMFPDLMRRHHWVLEPYQYESSETLIAQLDDCVIAPAEAKAKEMRRPLP